jgi:hypothetical protein
MSSKNSASEIAANIALEGGYDPCDFFSGNETFWTSNAGCNEGFVADSNKEYCYKILSSLENLSDGRSKCEYEYDANLILFHTNSEVVSFLKMVESGKQFNAF